MSQGKSNMSLKLYFDLMSQPSRALVILLQKGKVPFEKCPVALRKGEHMSDEFKKINRFQKVPAIDDGGFKLSESIAIVRYLSAKYPSLNTLYPTDLISRTRVDEFLEWQHLNVRICCALFFRTVWLEPILTGKSPEEDKVAKVKAQMENCLDVMENVWLADKPFLTGNSMTVADIFGCCEVEQPRMAGYEPRDGRPKLAAWMERVRSSANPSYDEAHAILNKVAKSAQGSAKL